MGAPLSDVRTKVRKAVMAQYKADLAHPFYVGTGGRLAYISAQSGWALPFAVFSFIGCDPADTFTERADELDIQISVWAVSSAGAEDLASAAFSLFEGHILPVAGLGNLEFYRTGVVPTMDESASGISIWQSGIELSGLVQTL